jgi:hypothetical protein
LLSVGLVTEGEEAIATGLARIHIPHNSGIRQCPEGTKGFSENLVVNLGAQITDEDVVMARSVLLVLLTLVSPVDSNFGVENFAPVESLQRSLGRTHIHVFHETIVETSVLIITVGNYFDMLYGASNSKNLCQHVLRNTGTQVPDVEMSATLELEN